MFDIQATIRWVTGMLTDPNPTAAAYQELNNPWLASFMQIVLPLYVGAYLLAALLAAVMGGSLLIASFSFFIFSLVWAILWTFVVGYIFHWLGNTFGGESDFNAGYALVALCVVPAALGTVLGAIPWIGWLLSLAAGIYGLVLAYRYIPQFLKVPDEARVKHFILSIIAALVVSFVVNMTLGSLFAPSLSDIDLGDYGIEVPEGVELPDVDDEGNIDAEGITGGLLGNFSRQAEVAEQATNDEYLPPSNGKITQDQAERFVYVLEKTQQLRGRLTEKLNKTGEDEKPSISDVFGGISDAMRAGTAEMEVVKTAGGNWAEHQWVRSQLETARIHEDLNDTTEHNFALYQKYKERLDAIGF